MIEYSELEIPEWLIILQSEFKKNNSKEVIQNQSSLFE